MSSGTFDPTKYTQSRWIKGADLTPGQPITGTIKAAYEFTFEQSGDTKPALDFYDLDQSMTLNKTQVGTMIELFGNDPNQWIGKAVQLMAVPSSFQGKPTILITTANGGQPLAASPAAPVVPQENPQPPMPGYDTNGNTSLQGDAANEVRFA
jgi:hypothetical protein